MNNTKRKASEFSYKDGCSDVFNNKKIKADSMADALQLSPFRTTANDEGIDYSFYTLVNKSIMQALSQLGVLDKILSSKLETYTEEPIKKKCI